MTCGHAHAPDGSPIELYAMLPAGEELDIVHRAIPAGATILELGCGAGRLTHRLIALGHPVVAVDQSPEMLAHVRGAETIPADIERLDLGRSFPVVLLAGHLVNVPVPAQRAAIISSCARHLRNGGILGQRLPPDMGGEAADAAPVRLGSVLITLRDVKREGQILVGGGPLRGSRPPLDPSVRLRDPRRRRPCRRFGHRRPVDRMLARRGASMVRGRVSAGRAPGERRASAG